MNVETITIKTGTTEQGLLELLPLVPEDKRRGALGYRLTGCVRVAGTEELEYTVEISRRSVA